MHAVAANLPFRGQNHSLWLPDIRRGGRQRQIDLYDRPRSSLLREDIW